MKVSELIEQLQSMPQDAEVILQKDAEGNGYSPLAVADGDAVYVATTSWFGEVYNTNWSADDAGMSDAAWERLRSKPRCVVLAPVN